MVFEPLKLTVQKKIESQNKMNTWGHMAKHRYNLAWQSAIRSALSSSPTVRESWIKTICQAEQRLQSTLSAIAAT